MTYTPINWQTGDTITAEKMNKMDNGWSVNETQLFSETVTATESDGVYSATLVYSQLIDADTITVNYDGTEYTCTPIELGIYGAPWSDGLNAYDFSEFPFNLYTESGYAELTTQTAGEHTISVSVTVLQTSANFDTARGYGYGIALLFSETATTVAQSDGNAATLAYANTINDDNITVTFDGTDYVCPRLASFGRYFYGGFSNQGPVFTEYPFMLMSVDGENVLYTETASTHTIAVRGQVMQPSADFSKAVSAIVGGAFYPLVLGETTWRQVVDAMTAGKLVFRAWGNAYDDDTTPDTQWAGVKVATEAYIDTRGDYTVTVIGSDKGVQSIERYSEATADNALTN